jgi:hypothetical protein
MDVAFRKFLVELWGRLDKSQEVYMVTVNNSTVPYILAPEFVDQEEYAEETNESLMMVFLDPQDAEEWGAMVLEIFETDNPTLQVTKKTLKEFYDSLDELTALSINEFKCPLRVDLSMKYDKNSIGTDVLFSMYRPCH